MHYSLSICDNFKILNSIGCSTTALGVLTNQGLTKTLHLIRARQLSSLTPSKRGYQSWIETGFGQLQKRQAKGNQLPLYTRPPDANCPVYAAKKAWDWNHFWNFYRSKCSGPVCLVSNDVEGWKLRQTGNSGVKTRRYAFICQNPRLLVWSFINSPRSAYIHDVSLFFVQGCWGARRVRRASRRRRPSVPGAVGVQHAKLRGQFRVNVGEMWCPKGDALLVRAIIYAKLVCRSPLLRSPIQFFFNYCLSLTLLEEMHRQFIVSSVCSVSADGDISLTSFTRFFRASS